MEAEFRPRLRYWFYRLLESSPRVWTSYHRRRAPGHPYVHAGVDVLVDGFYGSATTYVREAIRYANPGLRVASHGHSVAHVRRALQLGVPAIVTIREPADAVVSIRARLIGAARVERAVLDVPRLLRDYTHFYDGTLPMVADLVVVPFDEITTDPGGPLRRLCRRHDISLRLPTSEDEAAILERIQEWHRRTAPVDEQHLAALPDHRRERTRLAIRRTLAAPQNARLLERARAAHKRFLAGTEDTRW